MKRKCYRKGNFLGTNIVHHLLPQCYRKGNFLGTNIVHHLLPQCYRKGNFGTNIVHHLLPQCYRKGNFLGTNIVHQHFIQRKFYQWRLPFSEKLFFYCLSSIRRDRPRRFDSHLISV